MAPTAAGRTGEPSPTGSALGLTSDEAARRLRRHGPNALPEPPRPGTPRRVAAQLRSPLVGLLGLAAALSLALGELIDAAVILAVVALNALLGVLEERRADSAARALREVLRPTAVVQRDGRPAEVDVADLVPGDVVVLDAGDRVPADGRIVEAQELELDESMLTGESLPVTRAAGELLAGTTVSGGLARMEVTATGATTRLGEIVAAAGRTRPITPLERRLARLAHVLLIAGGGICVVLALIAWAYGMAPGDAALVGVALAVAAMPEGLPAVVSITLALGVRGMAREGAIVRRLHAVETLGCTTVICADKTGTLTENRMAVVRVLDAGGAETVRDAGGPVTGAAADVLRAAAVACEASPLAPGRRVGVEPTEAAVLEAAEAAGVTARLRGEGVRIVALEPFDSARRRVSALVEDLGGTRTVYVKGAPEALLGELDDGAVAARLEAAATRWGTRACAVLLVAARRRARRPCAATWRSAHRPRARRDQRPAAPRHRRRDRARPRRRRAHGHGHRRPSGDRGGDRRTGGHRDRGRHDGHRGGPRGAHRCRARRAAARRRRHRPRGAGSEAADRRGPARRRRDRGDDGRRHQRRARAASRRHRHRDGRARQRRRDRGRRHGAHR